MSENMLRGNLTSTMDAKGVLGFKGERGYSNYEIYVKNGGTMTEQEWLDHFGLDLTDYAKTSEVIDYVGELSELETEDKTDIVSAINENKTNIDSLDDRDNYSTTERIVGTWIDNKPIYSKTINFGSLPDNGSKNVAHNISNIDKVVNYGGITYSSSAFRTLPTCSPLNQTYNIDLYVDTTDIHIITGIDRTSYNAYVTIEYTKTTD